MVLTLASIPYSLNIGGEWCRVIYKNQLIICSNCDKAGHSRKNCPIMECCNCKKLGHISFDCLLRAVRHTETADNDSNTTANDALHPSNRNKTPGPDGLSVEFYAHFWQQLGEILVSVFNRVIVKGDLPASMKASMTRLVDKGNMKNSQLISLLNVDYKICSKAISHRLAKILGSIVIWIKLAQYQEGQFPLIIGFLLRDTHFH